MKLFGQSYINKVIWIKLIKTEIYGKNFSKVSANIKGEKICQIIEK